MNPRDVERQLRRYEFVLLVALIAIGLACLLHYLGVL